MSRGTCHEASTLANEERHLHDYWPEPTHTPTLRWLDLRAELCVGRSGSASPCEPRFTLESTPRYSQRDALNRPETITQGEQMMRYGYDLAGRAVSLRESLVVVRQMG